MSSKDYSKLEKEYYFKRSYLNKTVWWLNLALLAPIILLFGGLFGVMYLLNSDMLASWYSLPYVIIFAIGTIWFKTTRVHLQKSAIKKEGAFLSCVAQPIGELNGYTYNIFVTNTRRHDARYIENIARNLEDATSLIQEYQKSSRKYAIKLNDETNNTEFYLKAYFNGTLNKTNKDWKENNHFPILYINFRHVMIIKRKDLNEFL